MVVDIMTSTQEILDRITLHCRERGMAESTFGRVAVNDGKLVARLRDGGTISLKTLERIEAVLSAESDAAA
ncbi:hypothetical protein SAMN02745157_4835 [Kaistia soli DSM 19436]|uniref:Uncharacterized protein n=1 Tax=Kaistia soli DSM 19436 TaxID=1122133 RepID=A0A1M5MNM4_9HYPH|nr:hypothetical protein SAMN02745157_4835 [Kaistia soli DSM 19436]